MITEAAQACFFAAIEALPSEQPAWWLEAAREELDALIREEQGPERRERLELVLRWVMFGGVCAECSEREGDRVAAWSEAAKP